VGKAQEKAACNRQLVPIRYLQPLSQGLRPCQLPLHRGAKPCGGRGLARSRNHPLCARTGGPGGISPLVQRPPGRRGAGVQEKTSSKRANGGFRGAFRLWYKGPPAAFLSTFRRWKVDECPAAKRCRGPGHWIGSGRPPLRTPAALRRTRGAAQKGCCARRRGTFSRRVGAKRNAQSRRIANSLPQSPAATAPSSEGAKGAGIFPAGQLLCGSQGTEQELR